MTSRPAPAMLRLRRHPLGGIANREKLVPPDFISADGFAIGITLATRRYLAPLIQGEAHPRFSRGGRF